MKLLLLAVFTLLVASIESNPIEGQRYGRCHVYHRGLPNDHVHRRCYRKRGLTHNYCVEWNCPPLDCGHSQIRHPNITSAFEWTACPSCPGQCTYAGTIYQAGQRFTCLDGVNRCSCEGDGRGYHTEKGAVNIVDSMCKSPSANTLIL